MMPKFTDFLTNLNATDQKHWQAFDKLSQSFQPLLNEAQQSAVDLAKHLGSNLDNLDMGQFSSKHLKSFDLSKVLNEALDGISSTTQLLAQAGPYIRSLGKNKKVQKSREYLLNNVVPALDTTGKHLQDISKLLLSVSGFLPPGNVQATFVALSVALGALGKALTGLSSLMKMACEFFENKETPAPEKIERGTQRVFEALHSNAESIRELTTSLGLDKKAKEAHQVQELQKKATRLVWLPLKSALSADHEIKQKREASFSPREIAKHRK